MDNKITPYANTGKQTACWPGGKAVVFAGYSDVIHHLQQESHELAEIWQKKWWKIEILTTLQVSRSGYALDVNG